MLRHSPVSTFKCTHATTVLILQYVLEKFTVGTHQNASLYSAALRYIALLSACIIYRYVYVKHAAFYFINK